MFNQIIYLIYVECNFYSRGSQSLVIPLAALKLGSVGDLKVILSSKWFVEIGKIFLLKYFLSVTLVPNGTF